jgi:hypothetical protein
VHQAYLEPHLLVSAKASGSVDIGHALKFRLRCASKSRVRCAGRRKIFLLRPVNIRRLLRGKGDFMDVPVCYLLSLKSGRPLENGDGLCGRIYRRNPRHGRDQSQNRREKDGLLVAHRMEYIYDSGAYGAFKPRNTWSDLRKRRGRTRSPTFLSTRKSSTPKIPCGHNARSGPNRKVFAMNRKWISSRARLAMTRSRLEK